MPGLDCRHSRTALRLDGACTSSWATTTSASIRGRLRRRLEECGLIDLGGRWRQIEIDGAAIVLAGNERPWFGPVADLKASAAALPDGAIRIGLAHTPDQLAWAQKNHVDLLLTGHTHGGQICIPPLGPIVTPTIAGVKYVSGVYYVPPTILHTQPSMIFADSLYEPFNSASGTAAGSYGNLYQFRQNSTYARRTHTLRFRRGDALQPRLDRLRNEP